MSTYRDAKPSDQEFISRFQVAMAWETEKMKLDPETVKKGVRAVFEDPRKGRYLVAESGGKVVASMLLVDEWSDWRCGTVWWIHSVFVEPSFRRQGVFKGLYTFVKSRAQSDSTIRGLRLYVEKTNHAAQVVYEKLGMSGDHYHLYEWMSDKYI